MKRSLLALPLLVAACGYVDPIDAVPVELSGGDSIAFDDLAYAPSLEKIVAAGNDGRVHVVDPETNEVITIEGFGDPRSAHGGDGLVFAVDRGEDTLIAASLETKSILGSVHLAGGPDYVRYSEALREVWVTEPGRGEIEVFSLAASGAPDQASSRSIQVIGGIEGLSFDHALRRAYTQQGAGPLAVIDIDAHEVIARWPTGCDGTHGIPVVDEARSLVVAGCDDTRAVVLDAAHDGRVIGSYAIDSGTSILGYSAMLGHLYLRGDPGTEVAVLDVKTDAPPVHLMSFRASNNGHGMAADPLGHVFVCDSARGRLLRFDDDTSR